MFELDTVVDKVMRIRVSGACRSGYYDCRIAERPHNIKSAFPLPVLSLSSLTFTVLLEAMSHPVVHYTSESSWAMVSADL